MSRNPWTLAFVSYCGVTSPCDTAEDRTDARRAAAEHLRQARRSGMRATILRRGESWEFPEPEDCAMIPDSAGTLRLDPPVLAECEECGMRYTPDELPGRHFRGTCPDCIRDAEEAEDLRPTGSEVSDFVSGMVSGMLFTAGLWSDNGNAPCGPGDSTDPDDYFRPENAKRIRDDAAGFLEDPATMRILRAADGDFKRAGSEFHYCRNGHGAGFWDTPDRWGGPEAARYLSDAARAFGTLEIVTGTEADPDGPAVRWSAPGPDGGPWRPCETPEAEFDPATDSARFDVHR